MSKIVLILMATSAGLGLLSLHLVREVRAGQATIAELQSQVASMEKKQQPTALVGFGSTNPVPSAIAMPLEEAGTSKVAASPFAANSTKVVGSAVAAKPTDAALPKIPSHEERVRMFRESRERQRALMQDPDYREAMRVQSRSNFARSYPGVAQDLGLDPEQAARFFDLLSEQQQRSSEQWQPLWDTEGKDPAAMQEQQRKASEQTRQLARQNEAEIAAQFGQEKLQAWKEYQSTLGVRHQVEQMRTTLASHGVPLNEDSSKSMFKALADAHKGAMDELNAATSRGAVQAAILSPSGSVSMPEDMIERQLEMHRRNNQRTMDAISPYLTFEQREAIQKEQEAQLKLQQAHLRLMRAQGNAAGNADGGVMFIASPGFTSIVAEPVPVQQSQ